MSAWDASVLFADLVGFTAHAADIKPDVLVVTLDHVFARLDQLADQCGLEKIKTIGDAYLAVAGVPRLRSDHVEAAARLALGHARVFRTVDGLTAKRSPCASGSRAGLLSPA